VKPATRQALLAALLEAGFLVLGVVLAFAVNEWREAREDRDRAEAALVSVVEELRSNRDAVAEARQYHVGLLTRLRALRGEGKEPTIRDFPNGFIAPATPFRTAWESAADTGALADLPYDTVLRLSRLYAEQDRYVDQAQTAGEVIYAELLDVGGFGIVEKHAQLPFFIATFSFREEQLIASYDAALEWLEAEKEQP
jgi:hypothetical protein